MNIIFPNGFGAANKSILNNCTVVNNKCLGGISSTSYGGTYNCSATNCIIYNNEFIDDYNSVGSNCCVLKVIDQGPFGFGPGSFTNDPLYFDNGLHLQSNSPCIDAGISTLAAGNVDFDGRPRVVGAAVDIGATEFQGADIEPYISWLSQYGLPDDGSADYADSDGDGMNNWQEFIAGTNPTNAASVLMLQTPAIAVSNATITWNSVTNVTYYVQRSSNLSPPSFTSIQSNIVGQAGTTSYVDTNAVGSGMFFYRVGVQQ